MIIQLYYLTQHPGAEREYTIPQTSGNNPLNPGRADIANPLTGEIFEIKPSGNQGALNAGNNEVNTYVTMANQFCLSSLRGATSWSKGTNFPPVILPLSPTENLSVQLVQAGLVGYSKAPINLNTQPIVIPQNVREKFKNLVDRLQSIPNFSNPEMVKRIITEFLRDSQNQDMLIFIRSAAVGASLALVVATIAEDFATAGVGVADDIPCFVIAYHITRIALFL